MKVIENENVVFFDVDDTLVVWDHEKAQCESTVSVLDPYHAEKYIRLGVHEPHVKLLKNHKARGATIAVWSQSGYQWAQACVEALGLNEHVDLILTKPRAYVDDLPVSSWLPERIYIDPSSKWR